MKRSVWIMVFFLVEMLCLAMAAVFFVMMEILWGALMLLCAAGCSILLFAEGYERGWGSATDLRLETLEILYRTDVILARGEAMFERAAHLQAEAGSASSGGVCRGQYRWAEADEADTAQEERHGSEAEEAPL